MKVWGLISWLWTSFTAAAVWIMWHSITPVVR